MTSAISPGFYGRIPAVRGPVNINLPEQVSRGLGHWLQQCLSYDQPRLGQRWLPLYLACPPWRFMLSGGVLGPKVWAGVMIPSVDKEGHYYPFVVAHPLSDTAVPTLFWVKQPGWFNQLEQLALLALEDGVDLEQLQVRGAMLEVPDFDSFSSQSQWSPGKPLVMELASTQQNPLECYPLLLHDLLQQRLTCYSLWASAGNDQISPAQLVTAYLPSPRCYTSLIAGDWQVSGWSQPFPVAPPLAIV